MDKITGLVFLKKSTNAIYQIVGLNQASSDTRLCLCMNLHEEVTLTFQVFPLREIQESSEYFFCNKNRDTLEPTAISPTIMKLLPTFTHAWLVRKGAVIHDYNSQGEILSVDWKDDSMLVRRKVKSWFGFAKRGDYITLRASMVLGNFPLVYKPRMFEYIRFNLDIRAKT